MPPAGCTAVSHHRQRDVQRHLRDRRPRYAKGAGRAVCGPAAGFLHRWMAEADRPVMSRTIFQ